MPGLNRLNALRFDAECSWFESAHSLTEVPTGSWSGVFARNASCNLPRHRSGHFNRRASPADDTAPQRGTGRRPHEGGATCRNAKGRPSRSRPKQHAASRCARPSCRLSPPGHSWPRQGRRPASPSSRSRRPNRRRSAAIPGRASASTKRSPARRSASSIPTDPKNAVIVDIELAPAQRERQGRVLVRLLHPEADRPREGQPQGDVRAAESRRQDVVARWRACPAATTRAR